MNMTEITSLADIEKLEKSQTIDDYLEFDNTYDAIKAGSAINPSKTAISFFLTGDEHKTPHNVSYSELIKKITQSANFFNSLGLGEDDIVAFILPNLPETHYVIWGGEAACQILAINPLLEPSQIRDLINSAGVKAVVTMNPMTNIDLWPKLEEILPELHNVEHVIGIDIAQYVRGPKGIAAKAIQTVNRLKIKMPAGKKYHNFTSAIQTQKSLGLNFKRTFNDQTASSLFCTGGTTGLPKIARRTHRNELSNAAAARVYNGVALSSDKVILSGLPLFHVNGALITGLIPLSIGATLVIATPQGYRGQNVIPMFWDIVEHFKVSAFSAVPTAYSALMNFPTEGKDLSSLELGFCGAAPMPVETFKSFQDKTGIKILEGYGCTEGNCISSANPFFGEQKIGSIGLRLPFQDMACVRVDGNKITGKCNVDEIGVVAIKGPNVFLGYQQEHQNEGIWLTDENGDTWLNTGDLGREDKDGYFFLTGRKKELIVRGGHNIEPKMIEEAICKHPAINLAAAVGKPDQHAGEVPVCYVQVEQGNNVTAEELMSFAKTEIPEKAAIPKDIHLVDELPLTAVGKVFKPALEMQEIEKCVAGLIKKELPESSADIDVVQDPKQGILANIKLSNCDDQTKENFQKVLGTYTFKSALV